MKLWKKLFLILLVLVLLSQAPFAYRRYKLGRLHSTIQLLNSQREPATDASGFAEYKGVVHVHSFLGGHSTGKFEDLIAAAKSNQLHFVVMTEHTSANFNTAAMTLKGVHAGVLFVNGNEVLTKDSDRLLLLPGDELSNIDEGLSTHDLISQAKAKGSLAFAAYPEDFKNWEVGDYDGVEVYSVYTNAREINPAVMFLDGLWSSRGYRDLLFANFYSRPHENLKKWDQAILANGRRLPGIAGNDAHANVGITLNDASGKKLIGLILDPYETSFRLVRVHVLVPKDQPLNSETLLGALASGHCFIGIDLFCDSSGFSFSAFNGSENKIQGDEIGLQKEVRLTVSLPVAGRLVLIKDGKAIQDDSGVKNKDYAVLEKGNYRIEAYLPQLPGNAGGQPWIISNPIYVR